MFKNAKFWVEISHLVEFRGTVGLEHLYYVCRKLQLPPPTFLANNATDARTKTSSILMLLSG